MKRQLLTLILSLLTALTASAYDFEVDGIYYDRNWDGVSVTYSSWLARDYSGSVTIPSTVTYDGVAYSVTSIGDRAFYNCSNLTSITLPESVTSIGDLAFYKCSSLTSVTQPEGVTSIGDDAFHGCSSLTSITLPEGVTSIGEGAFGDCSSLTSITLPESVASIGAFAFGYCSSLEAFYGKFASEDHRCLIVDGVLHSFAPVGLTEYVIPEGVRSIGYGAFVYSFSLTSITLPESVTSIGSYAFSYCFSLTSITLPESLTSIGKSAFYDCSSLTEIICLNPTPPACGSGSFSEVPTSTCVLYVPAESVDAYKAAEEWKDFTNIQPIPEGGTGIEANPASWNPRPCHDLSGRRAQRPAKGIVIRDGKKMVVR